MVQKIRYSEWDCNRLLLFAVAGLSILLAGSCATAPIGPLPVGGSVLFHLKTQEAKDVTLVIMNDDDIPRTLLLNPEGKKGDRSWATSLKLPPGEYRYFFVVDGTIRVDPGAPRLEEDDFGGFNGIFKVERLSSDRLHIY